MKPFGLKSFCLCVLSLLGHPDLSGRICSLVAPRSRPKILSAAVSIVFYRAANMQANGFAIDVRDVTKKFGDRTVVNHIAMQVRHGEIYGFLGPNGSGKTTFLRMLCGLLRPDAGAGQCLGMDFRAQSAEIKKRVGYMTQRFSFYEDLSLEENLDFIARIYSVPDRKSAVDKSLERLGMSKRRKQLAGQLSGGWKQRLALAACLIHEPQLLLLDEPTAG